LPYLVCGWLRYSIGYEEIYELVKSDK
jgi:hypothetical protein